MRIIEDFLPPDVFSDINNIGEFWRGRGDFYWHELGEENNTIGSILSHEVDRQIGINVLASGVEYWPGVFRSDDTVESCEDGMEYVLPLHQDKDEVLAGETGEVSYPLEGCVLYFSECEGGLLNVYNEDGFYFLAPRPNRLALFDVRELHGVTPVVRGTRRSITMNFWANRPRLDL